MSFEVVGWFAMVGGRLAGLSFTCGVLFLSLGFSMTTRASFKIISSLSLSIFHFFNYLPTSTFVANCNFNIIKLKNSTLSLILDTIKLYTLINISQLETEMMVYDGM
ncbi:hypothetical protein TorRG33x02_332640 [Trema orientale]|uniref:Uncharacterized protein n=1 Tax=Trema orientale TaxID=63057 RepID=A0A2P5B532_TREOI|nr:hypothetical protein TorRG33x02_332640 [Trema orientale]